MELLAAIQRVRVAFQGVVVLNVLAKRDTSVSRIIHGQLDAILKLRAEIREKGFNHIYRYLRMMLDEIDDVSRKVPAGKGKYADNRSKTLFHLITNRLGMEKNDNSCYRNIVREYPVLCSLDFNVKMRVLYGLIIHVVENFRSMMQS